MREIPLTQGKVALVDDEDYDELIKHRWCASKHGSRWYALTAINHHLVYLHRFILPNKHEIDHINGDGLDNRKVNLRSCNRSQNNANRHKTIPHSSQFKGVTWDRQYLKWAAQISKGEKHIMIGRFASEMEAAQAYDDKAKKLFGEFARLNGGRN